MTQFLSSAGAQARGMIRPRVAILAAAIALVTPSLAAAHSFWLEPAAHEARAQEPVRVAFKVGDLDAEGGPKVNEWGLFWERIAALRSFGPEGVTDQQSAARITSAGEPGSARVSLSGAGTHIIAFASNPSFSDLEAARFNRYLDHEGLSAIAADRAAKGTAEQSGTELYARRAKALVQVGDTLSDVTKPIGHTLEIVPLAHPQQLGPAKSLPIRVLWRGAPLEGAKVVVWRLGEPGDAPVKQGVYSTGADGGSLVGLAFGERHMISVVWGEPAPNDARADFFTVFASLTFERD